MANRGEKRSRSSPRIVATKRRKVHQENRDSDQKPRRSSRKSHTTALTEIKNEDAKEVKALPTLQKEESPVGIEDKAHTSQGSKDKPLIKEERRSAASEDDSDSECEESIELRRLRNLEDNAKFLSSLGMPPDIFVKRKTKSKPTPKKQIEPRLPRRKSQRLQGIDTEGVPVPLPPVVWEPEDEHPRKPSGTTAMQDYLWRNTTDEEISWISDMICKQPSEKPTQGVLDTQSQDQLLKKLGCLKLRHFVKATPDRIFSIAFHPSTTKMLALTGDKWGHLAFWDVARGEEGVSTFIPHSRPINHLVCPPDDWTLVYSASYDGTLRATHLEKATFTEIYATKEEDDTRLTRFDFLSPESLLVAQADGNVAVVDTRTDSAKPVSLHPLHDRLVKCVNVHPQEKHYFLTSTNGGSVNLWDLRKLSKKRPEHVGSLPHAKSVDGAHFSPVNGHRILTTCYDNTLSVFDSSNLAAIKRLKNIHHNNQTGRWLSNFRAEWHPQREDLFVVGSMKPDRQIELFSSAGGLAHSFTGLSSVSSLNAFHPTLDALVGANSSGRVVAFY